MIGVILGQVKADQNDYRQAGLILILTPSFSARYKTRKS